MDLERRSEGEENLARNLEFEQEREGATGRIYAKEIELLDELAAGFASPP
jgi:hypothetical protein